MDGRTDKVDRRGGFGINKHIDFDSTCIDCWPVLLTAVLYIMYVGL